MYVGYRVSERRLVFIHFSLYIVLMCARGALFLIFFLAFLSKLQT